MEGELQRANDYQLVESSVDRGGINRDDSRELDVYLKLAANRQASGAAMLGLVVVALSSCAPNSKGPGAVSTSARASVSSTSGSSVAGPTLSPATTQTSVDVRPANLERFAVLSDEVTRVETAAFERLVHQCMDRQGRPYQEAQFVPSNAAVMDQLYPTENQVQTYGYGWRAHMPGAVPPSPPGTVPSQDYTDALGRCGDAASDQIGLLRYSTVAQPFNAATADVAARVSSDNAYIDAVKAWSLCMGRAGYSVRSPDDTRKQAEAFTPSSKEAIAVAVSDYGCQREAKLEETGRELTRRFSAEWLELHPDSVQQLREAEAALLKRSNAVLNG